MKNVIILLLLAFGVNGYGQIINFPDANFKNALVNTMCVDTDGDSKGDADADLNNDGEVDVSEVSLIKHLYIDSNNIQSMAGIEYFKNLKSLFCRYNKLASLDLRSLKNLESLNCYGNNISSLYLFGLNNLTLLYCSYNQISNLDFTGLKNLKSVYCYYNQITSIDVSMLNKLEVLHCGGNLLTYLNVSNLSNLKNLACDFNKITSIDLSGLISLEYLGLSNCQLTNLNVNESINLKSLSLSKNLLNSLDVSKLKKLTHLGCSDNQLTSLDLSELTNLVTLDCFSNHLKLLEVSMLKNLKQLDISKNQLTSLDVSGLNNLTSLFCNENQLLYLFIKTKKILSPFNFKKNIDLKYICCNEESIDVIKNIAIANGQNCEVNSYCSFTPGGEFYTIQGQNFYNVNNTGCNDPESKISNIRYKISNGSITGNFITNSTGSYTIPVQAGTHTITPIFENPDYFQVSPSSFTVTFPSTSDTISQNFCITPKGTFRQTNITIIPLTPPARSGFDAQYKIVWENVGNQIESGTLNFTYDETILDYISATQTANQVADGIVKWNFSNLLPFEKREITVTLKVNRPTDTPAVNAGDKLYLTASILDNIFTLENTVVGSYDPNDKTCLQGDRVKPDMVGKYVDYLIRFENTGNYAAENVVVKDIIDTKRFNVSTLQITDASHEVYTRIEGNKVEFIFENIQLPFDDANNDGYVAFKIKTLPTLVLGDSLKNLADIYFDYNFPIRTNEAQTTIALPSFTQDFNTEVNVYPNPVSDILYIESDENWSKAEIFDISGRILRSVSLDGQAIDVSGLESGTYLVRLKDGEKIGMFKFVKI